MKLFVLFLIASLSIVQRTFTAPDSTAPVTLSFSACAGGEALELGKQITNSFGENITVNRLKYYVSNVTFHDTRGQAVSVPASYFLVDEGEPDSKKITLQIAAGTFNAVTFLIGVDSIKNISGTQTGALDPMNGMFWTWNSGYIMAKLEGTSTLSTSPGQLVEYHIGGFRTGQNTLRRVKLLFPGGQVVTAGSRTAPEIAIEADVNKWFSGRHQLKIADHSACTTPGELAISYADNYADMFKITSIKNISN